MYQGIYFLSIRDFKSAANNFLDSISTFTSYELMDYKTFVTYTVLASMIALERVNWPKTKMLVTMSQLLNQGSQIRQIWRILDQNCSDDSTEVMEGVTSTPEIFSNKHSFVLTFFATNTIYINCKRCKP